MARKTTRQYIVVPPLAVALTCLLAALMCTAPLSAADGWPRFRGPSGDGHATIENPPLTWSDQKNVVWRTEIPGQGWSSPVVKDNKIFLSAAIPTAAGSNDFSLALLALDGDGENLQRIDLFQQNGAAAPKIHNKNSHASPTPIIDEDHIYVHFGHQGTACVDLNGKVVWRNSSVQYAPVHGNGGSPIVAGSLLIFSCDGQSDPFIIALNKKNGRVVWRTIRTTDARKKFSFSTPTLIEVNGRPQVVSPGSDTVWALDPRNGKGIWRVSYDGYSVIPKPVYGEGLVFISTSYDRPKLLAIKVDGRGDVTNSHVVWTADRNAPHTPSLLYHEGYLYAVSDRGIATCFEAASGAVQWQERLGGNYSASPLVAGGKIYFQSEEGLTTVVAAAPRFEKLAENELGERTLASFAVIDHDFLIRGEEHLYRVTR